MLTIIYHLHYLLFDTAQTYGILFIKKLLSLTVTLDKKTQPTINKTMLRITKQNKHENCVKNWKKKKKKKNLV